MSYSIMVGNILEKFHGEGVDDSWVNLTWGTISENDELLVGVYEDAGYPLDDKQDYEQLEVDEKAQWARDSEDFYSLQDGYYPIMNYVHVLQHKPTEEDILDIAKNARNMVVIQDEHENYLLGLSGGGMDFSEEIAYAYMVIDREVPKCFRIDEKKSYCLNDEAHKRLVDFIKEQK